MYALTVSAKSCFEIAAPTATVPATAKPPEPA